MSGNDCHKRNTNEIKRNVEWDIKLHSLTQSLTTEIYTLSAYNMIKTKAEDICTNYLFTLSLRQQQAISKLRSATLFWTTQPLLAQYRQCVELIWKGNLQHGHLKKLHVKYKLSSSMNYFTSVFITTSLSQVTAVITVLSSAECSCRRR